MLDRSRALRRALPLLLSLAACDQPARGADAKVDARARDAPGFGDARAAPDRGAADSARGDGPRADGPGADSGQCAPVTPAAPRDAWRVRAPGAPFGGIATQQSGPHTDVLLKSATDYTRVGARLEWGGTIVFFGLSADPGSNVIDANDTGRELQLALYDPTRAAQGCAHDASCLAGAPCPGSITYLGWNPVQGGDECGHGGKVLSYGRQGDALELVVQPVQWNPDWDQPTCVQRACPAAGIPVAVTYTFELRYLTEHVVEVASQVSSQESIDHPSTGQEFPTLYVSHGSGGPDLPLLLDAAGQAATIATPANDGFFVGNFSSPAPWVSWQRASRDYGVGLAMDQGITAFQGWRGDGQTAPYFHNVRAQIAFGLGAGKTVRGISYLALGNFATVKAELEGILAKRPPFGVLDAPAVGDASYRPGQPLAVAGWVLDTQAVATVAVQVDGVAVATLPVNGARPDVCAMYPAYAGCPAVGFSGTVTVGANGPCARLLRVVARDANGNATILGERRLVPAP